MPTDRRRRAPLDREAIVAAAVELADEYGVEDLTMRRLAERLGFATMALYNHVRTKDELLALVVDSVAGEIGGPPDDLHPWAAVRWIAVSTRATLVRHPWASEIWLRHLPGPHRIDQMERLLRTIDTTGLSADLAHHGYHAVTNHVLGYTLQERAMTVDMSDDDDLIGRARDFLDGIPAETYPLTVAHVHQHLDGDTASSFELVLDLILDGLVRLDRDRVNHP